MQNGLSSSTAEEGVVGGHGAPMETASTAADIVSLAERIHARIYEPVSSFEITAWRTPEPVGFDARTTGQELSLRLGDCWGGKLFDCAWFRFVGLLPPDAPPLLVARIDINGELCIVDKRGVPVRGLTCAKSTFDLTLGAPTKMIYRLPEHLRHERKIELWADAGFNDLFGMLPGEGRIEHAELCICREDLRMLYYDVQVLGTLLLGLPVEDPLADKVLAVVNRAVQSLGICEGDAVAAAREILKPMFAEAENRPNLRVSAIGHAHMDLAWLWPIRETIRKGARTFATALYNIDCYPDYIYGCSQPQLFVWMQEHYPELYRGVKAAVTAGRIEPLGRFWVEPDCNIPSGESLVRQVMYGAKFFENEFGIVPRFCWLPDVFGYNGQLPQILAKSGHDYFVTQKLSWNIVNRFPLQSFHWEGIDGTKILAHMLPEETYNSPASPQSLRKILNEYAQKDVSSHALMSYGIGDGGGGPDAEHLERILRTRHLGDLPSVIPQKVAEFLDKWAQEASNFPIWKGELYLERHQGTFTTQARTKRNNRLCEIGLREAEWAAALANILCSLPYPAGELDGLWQEILLYQFHDILPGSSIKRVYDESNARYDIILARIKKLIDTCYKSVASRVGSGGNAVVFNSLSWARREWLKLNDRWNLIDVPAMGYAVLPEPGDTSVSSSPQDSAYVVSAYGKCLENRLLKVEFTSDGSICSIFDKANTREVLAPGETGNRLTVIADTGDPWDFSFDLKSKDVWAYLRLEPQGGV